VPVVVLVVVQLVQLYADSSQCFVTDCKSIKVQS